METNYREQAEKAVGLTFNPSGDKVVQGTKEDFAQCIAHLMELRDKAEDGEVKRMLSIAITDAQSAQMWAVKAITWSK